MAHVRFQWAASTVVPDQMGTIYSVALNAAGQQAGRETRLAFGADEREWRERHNQKDTQTVCAGGSAFWLSQRQSGPTTNSHPLLSQLHTSSLVLSVIHPPHTEYLVLSLYPSPLVSPLSRVTKPRRTSVTSDIGTTRTGIVTRHAPSTIPGATQTSTSIGILVSLRLALSSKPQWTRASSLSQACPYPFLSV